MVGLKVSKHPTKYYKIAELKLTKLSCIPVFSRYNIVYFALTYMVPIVAMGVCYGQISSVLWGNSAGSVEVRKS